MNYTGKEEAGGFISFNHHEEPSQLRKHSKTTNKDQYSSEFIAPAAPAFRHDTKTQ